MRFDSATFGCIINEGTRELLSRFASRIPRLELCAMNLSLGGIYRVIIISLDYRVITEFNVYAGVVWRYAL